MFGGLGMGEMILIFLVVLLLFGAKRLPEIGSSLGKGIREFKTSMRDVEGEIKAAARPTYAPPPVPQPYQLSPQAQQYQQQYAQVPQQQIAPTAPAAPAAPVVEAAQPAAHQS
jgi:sec-independent protein translocase protein TatA